jgi:hypothetical protein
MHKPIQMILIELAIWSSNILTQSCLAEAVLDHLSREWQCQGLAEQCSILNRKKLGAVAIG